MLTALGLDPDEESVYQLLILVSSATAVELAPTLDRPVGDIAEVLHRLEHKGLATSAPEGDAYVAASPSVALTALLSLARDGLKQAEHAVETLSEQYRATTAARVVGDLIEVVTGTDAVRHRFSQLQHGAEREVLVLGMARPSVVHWSENTAEQVAMQRGVRPRVVLERALLDEPGALDGAMRSIDAGEEIRLTERLPVKLIVIDRRLAMVPLGTERPPGDDGAIVVHASGLLDALVALFDAIWEASVPLRLGSQLRVDDSESVTELDAKILSLQLAGLTDQAVAKQLEVSVRTIQRRMRHLMDIAGARTRLQLGWHAAEHGWLAGRQP